MHGHNELMGVNSMWIYSPKSTVMFRGIALLVLMIAKPTKLTHRFAYTFLGRGRGREEWP